MVNGRYILQRNRTLMKKSKLTSCASFKKSTKTSLLSMFGSTVTGKHGQRARLAWGWAAFSIKMLCPPGNALGLARAPLPPWRQWSLWSPKYTKICGACLLQAALTTTAIPGDLLQESLYSCVPESLNIHLDKVEVGRHLANRDKGWTWESDRLNTVIMCEKGSH